MTDRINYIDTSESLKQAIHTLEQAPALAIDLEFDKNFYRYGFNLCLVQLFTGEKCFLIDPLNDEIEIELLFPLLENDQVKKICFAFDEDLRLLNSIGCFPKNLFDLSLASRLINDPPMSLTNILKEHLGIDTGNSSQQSNWFKRPLTKRQLHYAAHDVLHLFELQEFIEKKGEELGVSDWIKQENELLDELDYSDIDHNGTVKEKEKNGLSEYQWFIYKNLLEWQNEMGQKLNRPAYQIIPKAYLTKISKDSRELMKWDQTNGIHRELKSEKYKQQLLDLIHEAKEKADLLNLSNSRPARKELSQDEHRAIMKMRKEINHAKKEIFMPLKNCIKQRYGAETANFLLSNRLISDLVKGNNGQLATYRKKLFLNCAQELGLNVNLLNEYLPDHEKQIG